jgi:hypothetical protein
MKIHLPVFALAANLFFTAAALAAPELTVEKGSHDFGSIAQGKKAQHSFTIRNSVIQPGKSGEIEVTFDSTNFAGKVQKNVVMTTNAGKTPSYTFKLTADIEEALQVKPRQLNLGPNAAGATKQASLTVTNKGDSSVKLLSVNVTSNSLQIKPNIKKAELKPGETGTIEFSVTPRPESKVLSGYLHIITSSPQKQEITVPVYGSVPK